MLWTTQSNLNFPVSNFLICKMEWVRCYFSVPPNLLSTLSALISTQETVCCHQQAVALCASYSGWPAHSPHHSWEEEEWGEIIYFPGSLAVNLPWVNCVFSQMALLLSCFWDHVFTSYSLSQLPVTPSSPCPCRAKGGDSSVAPILKSLHAPS